MQLTWLNIFIVASTAALARPYAAWPSFFSRQSLAPSPFTSSCSLSGVQLPTDPTSSTQLPSPAGQLFHVAIGRGTQNYTCDLSNSTAVPVSAGALATLFNVTCLAANYPEALAMIPALILDIARDSHPLSPLHQLDFDISGYHFFSGPTTPVWNLNTPNGEYGIVHAVKNATATPPSTAAIGQFNHGYGAVSWVYLTPNSTFTDNAFSQVYRINTAGGNPPTTCKGAEASFIVNYAAEYWFYK